MKARLFFAPPGINQKLYTLAIMRMLDHSKECIRKAQQRSLQFAKWGEPIVVGPREVDSLDAKKDKRKSNHINKGEMIFLESTHNCNNPGQTCWDTNKFKFQTLAYVWISFLISPPPTNQCWLYGVARRQNMDVMGVQQWFEGGWGIFLWKYMDQLSKVHQICEESQQFCPGLCPCYAPNSFPENLRDFFSKSSFFLPLI